MRAVTIDRPPLPPLPLTTMFCIYTPPRSMKFGPHVGNTCMYHLVYFCIVSLPCLCTRTVETETRVHAQTATVAEEWRAVLSSSNQSQDGPGRCAHVASACMHHAATKHSPNCTNNTSAQGHTTPPPEMHAHVLTRTYTRPLSMRSRWLFRSAKGASMLAE